VVSLVVAYASNRVIGADGALPWRISADMKRFKELTTGHAVVMGRRTFESLPEAFRPLPNRRNIVLSRSPGYEPAGAEAFADLDSAVEACDGDCFVIGGAAVYREALRVAQRIYATEIEADFEGDTLFPQLSAGEWRCVQRGERIVENGIPFTFALYERVASDAPMRDTQGVTLRETTREGTRERRQGTEASDPAIPLYNLDAARSVEQRRYMEGLEAEGICVFCPENVELHHGEKVELSGDHWYVTRNRYPYEGTASHHLIVARAHVLSFDQLPDEAGAELWSVKRELKRRLSPLSIASVERSDNMLYNGGSVAHLHIHFVALEQEPTATVRFRVSAQGSA